MSYSPISWHRRPNKVTTSATTVSETLQLLSKIREVGLLIIGATIEEPGDGVHFVDQMQGSGFTIPYIITTGDMALLNNLPKGIRRESILEKPLTGKDLFERIINLVSTLV